MISVILSALWQWFLGKFGMSDAQKLGRLEVQNTDLKAIAKAERDALDAQNQIAGLSDAAVNDELRSKWQK
jgi:hypothetical protein